MMLVRLLPVAPDPRLPAALNLQALPDRGELVRAGDTCWRVVDRTWSLDGEGAIELRVESVAGGEPSTAELLADREATIENVRAELRATGHGDVAVHPRLEVAVSQAIDKERHQIEAALSGWLHAETAVAAIGRLRKTLADHEVTLKAIERALGPACTGHLAVDVEQLVQRLEALGVTP